VRSCWRGALRKWSHSVSCRYTGILVIKLFRELHSHNSYIFAVTKLITPKFNTALIQIIFLALHWLYTILESVSNENYIVAVSVFFVMYKDFSTVSKFRTSGEVWSELHVKHWTNINQNTRRVYPEASGMAAWSENCKWYRSLPLDAIVSLFCESV
jgi:hypothetical protein